MRRAVAPVAHLAKVVSDIDLEHLCADDYKRIGSTPHYAKSSNHKAIDQQRHLLSGKFIDVEFDVLAKPKVCGHPQAFSVAVNNLVRNAFENTLEDQGPIKIRINEDELLVTNQLSGDIYDQQASTESSSHGYGLGLGIVQRLCERNGWSFALYTDENRVAARLSW